MITIKWYHTIHPRPTDYDWVFSAGGALIGGFTAQVCYRTAWHISPVVGGLNLVPALLGAFIMGTAVEVVYRVFIRPLLAG